MVLKRPVSLFRDFPSVANLLDIVSFWGLFLFSTVFLILWISLLNVYWNKNIFFRSLARRGGRCLKLGGGEDFGNGSCSFMSVFSRM